MRLFHGTRCEFSTPELDKCRKHKDFGQGFYLTENKKMAENWAKKQDSTIGPILVNIYEIDDKIFTSGGLNVKIFEANREWVEFVYNNREDEYFTHPYDIVIGPVADRELQKHFAKIQRGEKAFEDIVEDIHYNKFKGMQYCFCSAEAISKLIMYDRH